MKTISAKIIEAGAGFAFLEGSYVCGGDPHSIVELYRVAKAFSNIHTDDPRGNYVYAELEPADWDDCPEADIFQAHVDFDYPSINRVK